VTCGTDVEDLSDAFMAQLHRETRQKVILNLFADFPENATTNGFIYVPGGSIDNRYNTDVELPFRQESNFLYIFPCRSRPPLLIPNLFIVDT